MYFYHKQTFNSSFYPGFHAEIVSSARQYSDDTAGWTDHLKEQRQKKSIRQRDYSCSGATREALIGFLLPDVKSCPDFKWALKSERFVKAMMIIVEFLRGRLLSSVEWCLLPLQPTYLCSLYISLFFISNSRGYPPDTEPSPSAAVSRSALTVKMSCEWGSLSTAGGRRGGWGSGRALPFSRITCHSFSPGNHFPLLLSFKPLSSSLSSRL